MLGKDTHVRARKIISNYLLHVANMYFLQIFIQEDIGHACIFIVHDGRLLIVGMPWKCPKEQMQMTW